jgi:DNA polymerase/3'-5' exonuclease PolX
MKIEDKIEKYLKEGKMKKASKKEALEKIIKTIKSAKTDEQLNNAMRMIANFAKLYDPIGADDLKEFGYIPSIGSLAKLYKLAHEQKLKIKHIKDVQKELNK